MIWSALKGFVLGLLLFFSAVFLWLLFTTSHYHGIRVKSCEDATAATQSLKALSEVVENRWFQRKYFGMNAYADGPCMFYDFYPKPGALYFGQERASGLIVGVAMTTEELHEFADTVSSNMDFQKMLDVLFKRAKTHPAPVHEF